MGAQLDAARAAVDDVTTGRCKDALLALAGRVDTLEANLREQLSKDDTLDRTTRYCGACRHEEGAHWPSTGCAETGCKCQGFR
jgi:hypothetical protein